MSAFFENIKAVAAASNRRFLNGSMGFRRSTTNFQMPLTTSSSSSLSSAPNKSTNAFDGNAGDRDDEDDRATNKTLTQQIADINPKVEILVKYVFHLMCVLIIIPLYILGAS
jgi:hypothetical protein